MVTLVLLHDRDAILSTTSLAKLLPAEGVSIFSRCSNERTAGSVGTAVLPHEKPCPPLPKDVSFDCCRPKTRNYLTTIIQATATIIQHF